MITSSSVTLAGPATRPAQFERAISSNAGLSMQSFNLVVHLRGPAAVRVFDTSYDLLFDADPDTKRLENLYKRMPGAGGTVKNTHAGRFSDMDLLILKQILLTFPDKSLISFHDLAASSAITSLELFELISERRPISMHASDAYHIIYRVILSGVSVFFDTNRQPIQFSFWSLAISRRKSVASRILWKLCLNMIGPGAARRLNLAEERQLFHPRAVAAQSNFFTLGNDDMLHPNARRYDVVRALNALPSSYNVQVAMSALKAIGSTVEDGGLLILGRAGASIFRRSGDHFVELAKFQSGYQYPDQVLALRLETPTPSAK